MGFAPNLRLHRLTDADYLSKLSAQEHRWYCQFLFEFYFGSPPRDGQAIHPTEYVRGNKDRWNAYRKDVFNRSLHCPEIDVSLFSEQGLQTKSKRKRSKQPPRELTPGAQKILEFLKMNPGARNGNAASHYNQTNESSHCQKACNCGRSSQKP